MLNINYNPDVLSCLANLSNDEVFTPPKLVNEMLDMLPQELFQNKETTFLDPVTKSGVFLREIAKRLNKGLKDQIPDQQERINHIFTKQVYGIAITELTSLLARRSTYCSKYANGKYSVCTDFENEQGNIKYERIQHTWQNGKCVYCGASESEYSRTDDLETYAYQFIHTDEPQKLFNMKFDVIIGNPPYQLATGGSGKQAKPIYQNFINQAKKLKPSYLSMIIPARWYSGGFGLNEFRNDMLNDNRIKELVDFENSSEVFPGVDVAGGVCYFLWDSKYNGQCFVTSSVNDDRIRLKRSLSEFKIFIRQSKSIPIIRKIQEWSKNNNYSFLNDEVSSIKPFGLPSNYKPRNDGFPCFFTRKIGLSYVDRKDILKNFNLIKKWKVLIPKAPIAGQTDFTKPIRFYHEKNAFIAKPGTCCTESWIIASSFDSEREAKSFQSYLFTKIVRFLILQTVISQDVNKKNYIFVPNLKKYDRSFTDEYLIDLWNISQNEWEYIDSRILKAEL